MFLIKDDNEIWKLGYISIDRFNKYGSISMCKVNSLNDNFYIDSRTTPIMTDIFDEYFGDECNVYEEAKKYILMFDIYFEGCEFK